MSVKVKSEIIIRVQLVTGLRGAYGDADKINDNEYVVRLRARLKPRTAFLKYVHEMVGHVGAWIFSPFYDLEHEHHFTSALEKAADSVWKKYRAGKE